MCVLCFKIFLISVFIFLFLVLNLNYVGVNVIYIGIPIIVLCGSLSFLNKICYEKIKEYIKKKL